MILCSQMIFFHLHNLQVEVWICIPWSHSIKIEKSTFFGFLVILAFNDEDIHSFKSPCYYYHSWLLISIYSMIWKWNSWSQDFCQEMFQPSSYQYIDQIHKIRCRQNVSNQEEKSVTKNIGSNSSIIIFNETFSCLLIKIVEWILE